ncbi:hypothetical protein K439DRAFT_612759 [Ramaria rubella]|nr:hypothetical protein K439DRAFT_612759 [Ramaria rubella]
MLQVPDSPVPCISISFAPFELPPVEPNSPFAVPLPSEPDSPRPQHLLPPPIMSPNQVLRVERHGKLSPLSSSGSGKGLERTKFEAMLKASKERSAMVGAKKPIELRKEIALKVQKAKQTERRARFLSRVAAPPSPTAADMPVTPPESPAIFHFTLPSPGLESPLELFENLSSHPELYQKMTRIEQVDFRFPHQEQKQAETAHQRSAVSAKGRSRPLPSLDQISQRLSKNPVSIATSRAPSPDQGANGTSRLPQFLRSRSPSPVTQDPAAATTTTERPRLTLSTDRSFGHPLRTPPSAAKTNPTFPQSSRLNLQITTTICPPTRSKSSPTEFTEENIIQFDSNHSTTVCATATSVTGCGQTSTQRAQAAKDMFNKLSRRTSRIPGAAACGIRAKDDTSSTLSPPGPEDKLRRRTSAPAEMSAAQRSGRHPILERPGGF